MTTLIFAVLIGLGSGEKEEPAANPQAELNSAISYGLELLNEKDYENFIQKLARPADLKKILETKKLDELVEAFSSDKAKKTILALKHIQNVEPTLNEDGTVAEFPLELNGFPQKTIVFERVEGLWYIRN